MHRANKSKESRLVSQNLGSNVHIERERERGRERDRRMDTRAVFWLGCVCIYHSVCVEMKNIYVCVCVCVGKFVHLFVSCVLHRATSIVHGTEDPVNDIQEMIGPGIRTAHSCGNGRVTHRRRSRFRNFICRHYLLDVLVLTHLLHPRGM